jgi:hypothetical protein
VPQTFSTTTRCIHPNYIPSTLNRHLVMSSCTGYSNYATGNPIMLNFHPPIPSSQTKGALRLPKQDALSYGVSRVDREEEERFVPIESLDGKPFDVQRDNLFFQAFAAWWHPVRRKFAFLAVPPKTEQAT